MSRKRPINVEIRPRNRDESLERMIRRFTKKCKKERITEKYRERMYYEKPSEKKIERKTTKKTSIRKTSIKEREYKKKTLIKVLVLCRQEIRNGSIQRTKSRII